MNAAETEYHYVYILTSDLHEDKHYTGQTQDLAARLAKHNRGEVSHTSKHRPWKIETAISFHSKDKAIAFERYLKSGSGREFARRHF